jgi:hypothetical protein
LSQRQNSVFDQLIQFRDIIEGKMKIDDIRKMRNRAPFRRFFIHLTTGEVLPVEHPESMSLPDDEREMFVLWTRHDWNLLEAEQVARISVRKRNGKSSAK